MDDFNTIRLKRKTLEEFKEYSLKTSPNYSETLEFMIGFFKDTGISPYDTLNNPILASMVAINKRLDYIIALLKDIEKTQLIPTREMLESLFKEVEEEKPLLVEKKKFKEPTLITENEELTYYRKEFQIKKAEMNNLKYKLRGAFVKFKLVKNTFSSNQYVLKVSEEEFLELKNSIT